MALIKVGSLDDFSVVALESAAKALSHAKRVDTFSVLAEVSNKAPQKSFDFRVSKDHRGLALQSLQLKKEFQTFLARLFNKKSKIYFLAWAWDMASLSHYPGMNADPSSCLIPLKAGELREFIGAGAVLFPPRPISAGLALRVQIWESHQKLRDFGKVMSKIASAIDGSDLSTILIGLAAAPATGGASAAISLMAPAAQKLAQAVGDILKESADDVVDYFEGYFPAAEPWPTGSERHNGQGTTIVLKRLR